MLGSATPGFVRSPMDRFGVVASIAMSVAVRSVSMMSVAVCSSLGGATGPGPTYVSPEGAVPFAKRRAVSGCAFGGTVTTGTGRVVVRGAITAFLRASPTPTSVGSWLRASGGIATVAIGAVLIAERVTGTRSSDFAPTTGRSRDASSPGVNAGRACGGVPGGGVNAGRSGGGVGVANERVRGAGAGGGGVGATGAIAAISDAANVGRVIGTVVGGAGGASGLGGAGVGRGAGRTTGPEVRAAAGGAADMGAVATERGADATGRAAGARAINA